MKLKIEIDLDSEAFLGIPHNTCVEVGLILERYAAQIKDRGISMNQTLITESGGLVGGVELTD